MQAEPRTPTDPDLYLVVTYPNMAAFDVETEKMTAIDKKLWGSLKASDQGSADRESIRKILGTERIRELMPVKK